MAYEREMSSQPTLLEYGPLFPLPLFQLSLIVVDEFLIHIDVVALLTWCVVWLSAADTEADYRSSFSDGLVEKQQQAVNWPITSD